MSYFSILSVSVVLACLFSFWLFKKRKQFLDNQVKNQIYTSAISLRSSFYNGTKYSRRLDFLSLLAIIPFFLVFLPTPGMIALAIFLIILPGILIELFVPKVYRFDFIIISWVLAFLLGVFVSAGIFIVIGDLVTIDPILLDQPTALAQKLSSQTFDVRVFSTLVVAVLVICLAYIFKLLRVLPSTFLSRFKIILNLSGSTKNLCLQKRFGSKKLVEIDLSKPFDFEEGYDSIYSFSAGVPTPQKVSIFSVSQNNQTIIFTGSLFSSKNEPLVRTKDIYLADLEALKNSDYIYQIDLYEDKFYAFGKFLKEKQV